MVTLATVRDDLAADLRAAGFKADDYLADRVTGPCAVIVPDDPYVETSSGDVPFGHARVNLTVLVIGSKGTNRRAAAELDGLLEAAIAALADWEVSTVSAPYEVDLNGHPYLGVALTINENVPLTAA